MQGRLVPPVGDRIQAFPVDRWRDEFPAARQAGLQSIEWIYDTEGDDINPVATDEGLAEMMALSRESGVQVKSLCADYFMSETLLRGTMMDRQRREGKLQWLIARCAKAGIGRVVLPFVDSSNIESDADFRDLVTLMKNTSRLTGGHGVELHLETSLPPSRFASLLDAIGNSLVKVNYDSGNSASLGFDVNEEFEAYSDHIGSVHIKDRVRGGSTVPLGTGSADFAGLACCLKRIDYSGDFILQVARSTCGDEIAWAMHNRDFFNNIFSGNS